MLPGDAKDIKEKPVEVLNELNRFVVEIEAGTAVEVIKPSLNGFKLTPEGDYFAVIKYRNKKYYIFSNLLVSKKAWQTLYR